MVERGIGEYQIKKAEKSRTSIINALASGDAMQYHVIVSRTGLSTATVSKFLKKLVEEGEIEKKIDTRSGKYPYPVHYRLTDKGLKRVNKDALQKRIEATPLEFSSYDITRRSLKARVDVPGWYKKIDKLLAKLGVKETDPRGYDWPVSLSIVSDSKLVREWRTELERQAHALINERHPKLKPELLEFYTKFLISSLFGNLEEATHLNILTPLKLPPIKISKYKPLTARYDLGLYAKVYSRLMEAVILLLMEKYEHSESFEDFLKKTRGTSIILTIDSHTDFHSIVEYFDKKVMETEQLLGKGRTSHNHS